VSIMVGILAAGITLSVADYHAHSIATARTISAEALTTAGIHLNRFTGKHVPVSRQMAIKSAIKGNSHVRVLEALVARVTDYDVNDCYSLVGVPYWVVVVRCLSARTLVPTKATITAYLLTW
jgi:hypothetical protein